MLLKGWNGVAILLLGALSLLVPDGHLIALVALLGSLPLFLLPSAPRRLGSGGLWPVLVVMLLGGIWLLVALWHGETSPTLRLVWPMLLCVPLFWAVWQSAPSLGWLWCGLALGGVGLGGWALIQAYGLGDRRVDGHAPLHPILFGNLGLLTGLFCLAGLGWARRRLRHALWSTCLLAGAAGGLVTSLLSGTRGGWVVLPLLLALLFFTCRRHLARRTRLGVLVAVLVAGVLAGSFPQTGVQARLALGFEHVSRYLEGERTVRTGARIEIWRTAGLLIAERPWWGWGDEGYRQGLERLVEQGRADPEITRYWHAHNDLLDAWVRRGGLAALALLMVYLVPVLVFWRGLGSRSSSRRALATCGILLAAGYFGFGLSYSFMVYPVGPALYTLWFCAFWALYQSAGQHGSSTSRPIA